MRYKISRRQPGTFKQLSLYLAGPKKGDDKSQAFDETALYLAGEAEGHTTDRVLWKETRNLHTDDPRAAAAIMEATTRDKPSRCKKPAYHFILAFDPEDDKAGKVNPEMMKEIADKAIDRLELQEHQALIYAHQDKEHPHIHFLVNRIHPETGKAWNRHNEGRRLLEFCGDMAREYDLNIPRDLNRDREQEREQDLEQSASISDGEYWQAKKESRQVMKFFAPELVEEFQGRLADNIRNARNWDEFDDVLMAEGLHSERKGQGLILTDGKRQMKLSALGKDIRFSEMEKKYGQKYHNWFWDKVQTQKFGAPKSGRDPRNAIDRADMADMEFESVNSVFKQALSAESRMRESNYRYEAINRSKERQKDWEKKHEVYFLTGLNNTYRDPAHARREWIKLDGKIGWDRALERIGAEPEILGKFRGVEVGGTKSPERKKAERTFRYLKSRRLKWLKSRDRTNLIYQKLENQQRLLAEATRDYRKVMDSIGRNNDLMAMLKMKIKARAYALDQLTPKMIREAALTEGRREELHRAYRKHQEQKRAKSRDKEIGWMR